MAEHTSRLATILREHESRILADWIGLLATAVRSGALDKAEIEENDDAISRYIVRNHLGQRFLVREAAGPVEGCARPAPSARWC